ncbi:MAG: hypothetical protein MUP17_09945, partial [candidate division Zixibacteria bacterium]|nr:hypothetical protein [candidate division Zixibacteria bacterium]
MNGILFKPWKIKAIAESDREWQTRRLGGLKEINEHPDEWIFKGTIDGKYWFQHPQCERDDWLYNRYIKPRYQVGEVVYIKEAYCHKVDPITAEVSYDEFWYRLDNPDVIKVDGDGGQEFNKDGTEKSPWVSPLLMPQSAARYFTKITDVRAERVQDITEEDAKAEGIDPRFCTRRIEIEPGISSFISGAKARFSI